MIKEKILQCFLKARKDVALTTVGRRFARLMSVFRLIVSCVDLTFSAACAH